MLLTGHISITHAEFRRAKECGLPVLAFIEGERHVKREEGTISLLAEIDADGPKYKRFGNVIELQREVRAALVKLLLDKFGIAPTSDEDKVAEQTIEATSLFESSPLNRVRWKDLDLDVVRSLVASADKRRPDELVNEDLLAGAMLRGLVWHDPSSGEHCATAAGIVLLARDPSAVFPQCRILADAYRSTEPTWFNGRIPRTKRCCSRRGMKSGRAGGIPARKMPIIPAQRNSSTATSSQLSMTRLPAVARCHWKPSGLDLRATPVT